LRPDVGPPSSVAAKIMTAATAILSVKVRGF